MSSKARNEFDGNYDDRLQKSHEAAAAAIRQLDQLRSTEPTPRQTFDAEVARIAQEKPHPYRCDLVVHRMDDQFTFTQSRDFQKRESALVNATKTEVAIDNFAFSPNTLTLSVGGRVTWTNYDNVPHVVSSADNQFKKSPLLKTG